MTNITRSEVLNNRKIWISHLLNPQTQKTTGKLEDADNPKARCCLGHACHLFIPHKRTINKFGSIVEYENSVNYAPNSIINVLGLHIKTGGSLLFDIIYKEIDSLAELNDSLLNITQAEIGLYLASVIEGGSHTPFRPLSDYPEEA